MPAHGAVAFDPVTQDPPPREPPPSMDDVRIASGGVDMNGIVYLPGGAGPHPVAILLHGLPGNERNLDLAQALRRAGWAVVFFHYRGAWGSPGAFGFRHVLEDTNAVVNWTTTPAVRARFAFDDGPRTLVGHSMGGFAALGAGAQNGSVGCVASIAGANMGLLGPRMDAADAVRDAVTGSFDAYARGPLAGTSGALMVAELIEDAERFDVQRGVAALAERRLLLVGGSRDTVVPMADHHAPMLAALRARDADVEELVLDDDHAFSASRIALAHALVAWLGDGCD
ncbi:MAG TPA: alpha/beta fold hydrolase [Pseudomonadales bacterium]|nr:alpha/beta fold hydrolase [Pseudomonadales bacterium]